MFGREDETPITAPEQQKMREIDHVKAVVSRSYLDGVSSIKMDDRSGNGDGKHNDFNNLMPN